MIRYCYRAVIYLLIASYSNAYSQALGGVPAGLDAGTVKDSTYSNIYFAMKLTIPDGWQVQDNKATRELTERGRNLVVGDDKNLGEMIKASEKQGLNLLTMFKYPVGSPVEFNPAFMCIAERVDYLPGIKKGSDYLFHVRKGLAASKLQVTFDKDIYVDSVSGREFSVLDAKLAVGTKSIRQKYYATILKGYALSFIFSFTTDEELQTQNEIIKSIRLE